MKHKKINKPSSLSEFEYLSDGDSCLSRKKPRLNRRKFADDLADCADDDDDEDENDEEDEYDMDDDFIASESEEQDGKKIEATEQLLFDGVFYFR